MGAQNQPAKWSNPNASTSAPPTWEQQVRNLFVTSYMRDNQIQHRGLAARLLRESVAERAGFNLRTLEAASWKGLELPPEAARFLQCWCPGCSIGNNRFTITSRPQGGGPLRYPGCYFPVLFYPQGMDSPASNPWELDADELTNLLGGLLEEQRVQRALTPWELEADELTNLLGCLLDGPMENGQSWTQTRQQLLSTSSYPRIRIPEYFPKVNFNSKGKGNITRPVIPREYSKNYSNLEKENRQCWTQTGEQLLSTPSHPTVYIPQHHRVRIPDYFPKCLSTEFQALFANFDYSSPEESEQDENGAGDDEPTEPFPAYVESAEMLEEIERENRKATNSQQRTYAEVLRMTNNTSSSNARTKSNMEPNEEKMQAYASRFGAWGMNSSSIRQPPPAHLKYRKSSWVP